MADDLSHERTGTERLPLFPLGTVLFPGVRLPLDVFEPRYRRLVADLQRLPAGLPRRFGVVAISAGSEVGAGRATALFGTGCVADVETITTFGDGRSELATTGSRRFRLRSVDAASEPYLTASVEWLDEPVGDPAEATRWAGVVAGRFGAYRQALTGEAAPSGPGERAPGEAAAGRGHGRPGRTRHEPREGNGAGDVAWDELPADPRMLSYAVADAMILDVPDKQRMLEAADAAGRLRIAAGLLRRENGLITRLGALPALDLARAPGPPTN